MKRLYTIKWHRETWFEYFDAETGKRLGKWDIYHITEKGRSQLPYQFLNEIKVQVGNARKEKGRKMEALRLALFKTGYRCGFTPEYDPKRKLILWTVRRRKGVKQVVAISALHCRWRKNRYLTKPLIRSKAFLRLIVDNNNRSRIWLMPKREI